MTLDPHDINLTAYFERLTATLDYMEEHRVAMILTTGATYFVSNILQEWDNAIQFHPEGHMVQPLLVFKSCIEAIKIMDRPAPRAKPKDTK
jgi:hypothetical protein